MSLPNGQMTPELKEAVQRVMSLMLMQHHPHTTLIIDSGTAQLVEGVQCTRNPELYPKVAEEIKAEKPQAPTVAMYSCQCTECGKCYHVAEPGRTCKHCGAGAMNLKRTE